MQPTAIDALLQETRVFPPSDEFVKQAHVNDPAVYDDAAQDYQAFWAKHAAQCLHWFEKWRTVLEWNPPYAKWFIGGKLNACYNCVDRHAQTWRRTKAALIWEGEPGDERVLTYGDLHREVQKFANVLKSLGVQKGDRVCIYMPLIPEAAIAMLACARIGAPHSVVFGGFSADALADRIRDAQAKVLITADGGWRRGAIVPLKRNADDALRQTDSVQTVIVYQRIGGDYTVNMQDGRDLWWHDLVQTAPLTCPAEPMDSEDLLYLLYTSGSTGKPKGLCTPQAAI